MPTLLQQTLPAYAELQCVTNFSFLRGAPHGAELVVRAAQPGYSALAIADECSLAGVVRAHIEARRSGLLLIIGSHFQLVDEDANLSLSLILLACNREGYGNLCELVTLGRTRAEKERYRLTPADLNAAGQHSHLHGMPDCLAILTPAHDISAERLAAQAEWLRRIFPRHAWIALLLLRAGDVCMHVSSRKPLQDTLSAIRLGQPIAECGKSSGTA